VTTSQRFIPRGIWPPLLMNWDERWNLDLHAFDANLARLVESGPHGLYTLDTASEFHTMEFDEWDFVARRFVAACRRLQPRLPIGLGCTWTHQAGALRRVAVARDLGVGSSTSPRPTGCRSTRTACSRICRRCSVRRGIWVWSCMPRPGASCR